MGKSREDTLAKIADLEDEHCKGCKIKLEYRRNGHKTADINTYCVTECKIGKKIKTLGGIIQYGKLANAHLKATDLTKDKYIDYRDSGKSDAWIREKYKISKPTLTRRKVSWGLNKNKRYTIPSLVLKDLTREQLAELSRDHFDYEIADMLGVNRMSIFKRRQDWGIKKERVTILEKFTLNEYKYLSEKKGLNDAAIAELWEISGSSLLKLKKAWGIARSRQNKKPEEVGLTPEKMLELVPLHSDQEIADMFGLKLKTVINYRKELGISASLRWVSNRIKPEEVQKLLDQGLSKTKAAYELGIDRDTLRRIIGEI